MRIEVRDRTTAATRNGLFVAHGPLLALIWLCVPNLVQAQVQVSALGRLEPWRGTLQINAPTTPDSTGGTVLGKLLVESGDDVKAGQLLAVSEIAALMQAQVELARAEREQRRRLATAAKSAASASCVHADVAALVSQRQQDLLARQLASAEDAERAKGEADAGRASCTAAGASAAAAEAGIAVAEAALKRAGVALERSNIRSPISGRVLDVYTRPGEMIGPQGILELGHVERMYAIAEVYETDVGRVRVGQTAIVTSRALPRPLAGVVERIRLQVRKQDQLGTDPAARKDARIVEVEIRLNDSAPAAALTNLQVEVAIGRQPGR